MQEKYRKIRNIAIASTFIAASAVLVACQKTDADQSATTSSKPSFPETQDKAQKSQESLTSFSQEVNELEQTTREFINPTLGELTFHHLWAMDLINGRQNTSGNWSINDHVMINPEGTSGFDIQVAINNEARLKTTKITADFLDEGRSTLSKLPSRLRSYVSVKYGVIPDYRLKSAARAVFNLPDSLGLTWSFQGDSVQAEGRTADGRYLSASLTKSGNAKITIAKTY